MDTQLQSLKDVTSDPEPLERLACIYVLRLYREAARTQRPLRLLMKERGALAAALDVDEAKLSKRKVDSLAPLIDARLAAQLDGGDPLDCAVARNVLAFGSGFGLSPAECRILLLAVVASADGTLDDAVPGGMSAAGRDLVYLTAVLTGLEIAAVRNALSAQGLLMRSGLIRRYDRACCELSERLELLDGTANAFLDTSTSAPPEQRWLAAAPASACRLEDVAHLAAEVGTAIAVVKGALAHRARGVQILLHGEPGVGKTELARLIAMQSGAATYLLPDARSDGAPLQPDHRLRRYAFMQRLLAHQRGALLILDEVEEMLASPDHGGHFAPPSASLKSWKNRLIEASEVPGIWIANWIHAIDPALLRRFTLTLRVPTPPARLRVAMLARHGKGYAENATIRSLITERDDISPADIERARTAAELAAEHSAIGAPECFLQVLSMRAAASHDPIVAQRRVASTLPYRVDWLNTDPPVQNLVSMLAQVGEARLCFWGPPGTGKTALARHLAQALGRPLHAKKASDLVSCWVGQTEQNIAAAFAAARREGALLLLDEADSFLRTREGAQRGYEVTEVNQLLKELENFDGLVALCTNFFETLDAAVLRRLDFKVRFAPLTAAAAGEALLEAVATLGADRREGVEVLESHPLVSGSCTLGDIAVALRQARLRSPVPSARLLRDCVEAELHTRQARAGRPIGFAR